MNASAKIKTDLYYENFSVGLLTKKRVVVFPDLDVFDKVSKNNKLLQLELRGTCLADTVTDVSVC